MADRKEITVKAELRGDRGKNDARRLRSRGLVPLTIYGGEGGAVSAAAPLAQLAAILRSESGHNTIFTLDVEGAGASEVMFHDRQLDPVRGRLVHADLRRLVLGQKIEVTVNIVLDGEPVGVTEGEDGSVLEQLLREVQIRCSPRDIPDAIHADVAGLGVHEVMHVADLKVGDDIEIVTDPETAIATVAVVREEPVEEPVVDESASEPEVMAKGKKEDEGGDSK